eukprot:COSAG06_NODE_938_length_11391_cov_13.363974_9_plen_72_part_00
MHHFTKDTLGTNIGKVEKKAAFFLIGFVNISWHNPSMGRQFLILKPRSVSSDARFLRGSATSALPRCDYLD